MKIRLSEIERGCPRLAMEHAGYTKMNKFARDLLLSFAEQQIGDEVDQIREKAIDEADMSINRPEDWVENAPVDEVSEGADDATKATTLGHE